MTQLYPNQNTETGDRSETTADFDAARSRIVNGCLIGMSLVAIPALVASLYRVVDIGWQPVMYLHIVLAALIISAAFVRERLPYTVRAGILIGTFMALGLAGTMAFGLAANGRFFFLGAIVLSVMFFGIVAGSISLLVSVSALAGTFALMNSGYISFDVNANALLTSFSAWITSINSLILLSAGIGLPLSILLRQLVEALDRAGRDRARLAQAHKISEEFFSKAFHSSPLVVVMSDPDTGKVYDVNQACIDTSGYTREEFLGKNAIELGVWANLDDRKIMRDRLKRDRFVNDMETVMRTKDGRLLDVLITADLIKTAEGERVLLIGQNVTRLKDISRMKSEFISIVSHELRTPLTSIVGALKLAHSDSLADVPEQRDKLLSIALKNSTRLTELVNDLLDLDKLQSGAMTFNREKIDLAAIVMEATDQSVTFAAEHGVSFVTREIAAPTLVDGDAQRLNQVIVNMLSNAANFSPRGTEVAVSVSASGGYGRVEIADHGPGIPDSFRAQLFDRFTQVDSSNTRKVQGSGLGLHICKSIVDAHGGRIDFRSNEGGGTIFFFEIPLWDNAKHEQ